MIIIMRILESLKAAGSPKGYLELREREEREATQSSPMAHLEEGMRLKSLTPLLAQLRKSHDPNTHL